MNQRAAAILFLLCVMLGLHAQTEPVLTVSFPNAVMKGVEYPIEIAHPEFDQQTVDLVVNGEASTYQVVDGKVHIAQVFKHQGPFVVSYKNQHSSTQVFPVPLWMSLVPSLLAIAFALLFKEVFSALFIGIFAGAFIQYFYQSKSVLFASANGLLSIVDTYIPHAMMDEGHVSIIVFSMLIGGVVNVINKNGGMNGFVNKVSGLAKSARSTQMVTWFLGLFIFFDDYANTLVVGNTMRPVTDKWKVSREKLAYIVDSTAAPIAAIAFVTTWIGAELSYIKEGLDSIGLNQSPYTVFMHSLKYSFYPVFTLLFVGMLVWQKKEFGPMLAAERRMQKEGISRMHPLHEKTQSIMVSSWLNGVVPVVIIIVGTLIGLLYTGWDAHVWNGGGAFATKLSETIGNADSYRAMLWSSLAATLVAIGMSLVQKLSTLRNLMEHLLEGYKSMLQAVIVLVLAWALASINDELRTAEFISQALINFDLAVWLVPAITFLLSLSISFATGSAWGTMAILYPLVMPAAWMIASAGNHEMDFNLLVLYNVVSCVLAGSVLGDHISPISDTTIMSSLASSCNHIAHVRTQIPYALTVGGVSLLLGTIPVALGVPPVFCYALGLAALYLILRFFGKEV